MAGYIGSRAAVATSGVERKKTFAITTTTTSLTGLDYTPNHVHVFHNGIRLVDGTDYTATNGTSITLVNAAENGDEVVVVSLGTFSPADTYTKTEADDRYVNASGDTMTGNLFVDGQVNDTDVLRVGYGLTELAVRVDSSDGELRLSAQDGSGNNYTKYMTFYTEGGSGPLERMRIDSAGRVTMPYQPSFNVYQSAPLTLSAGTWTQNVNLDTARHNVGNHFNTSNGAFTAPVSGKYLFCYTTHFNSSTSNYFYVGVAINGAFETYLFGYNDAISGGDNTFGGSIILHINANDVVTFWNYDGDGGTVGHGFQRTNASGHLIG